MGRSSSPVGYGIGIAEVVGSNPTRSTLNWHSRDFNNNNDIIWGGEGNNYIQAGEGSDSIQGGAGDYVIYPNGYRRDSSFDSANCGSGTDDKIYLFYSGDNDFASNCELIWNRDR